VLVHAIRYGLICDNCSANSFTDECDQYQYPIDDQNEIQEATSALHWSHNNKQDLCPTCTCENEGHSFQDRWTMLPQPSELRYQDCFTVGCLATMFSDETVHRRHHGRICLIRLVPYTTPTSLYSLVTGR
jgi:hypothetical protein